MSRVRRSGWRGDRWLPGITGEGVADAGDDVGFVFADGVDVAADVEAVLGDGLAGESSGGGAGAAGGAAAAADGAAGAGGDASPAPALRPIPLSTRSSSRSLRSSSPSVF